MLNPAFQNDAIYISTMKPGDGAKVGPWAAIASICAIYRQYIGRLIDTSHNKVKLFFRLLNYSRIPGAIPIFTGYFDGVQFILGRFKERTCQSGQICSRIINDTITRPLYFADSNYVYNIVISPPRKYGWLSTGSGHLTHLEVH